MPNGTERTSVPRSVPERSKRFGLLDVGSDKKQDVGGLGHDAVTVGVKIEAKASLAHPGCHRRQVPCRPIQHIRHVDAGQAPLGAGVPTDRK